MLDLKALPQLRKNLRVFIDADPLDLVIRRPAGKHKTSSGGWVELPPSDLPPQRFRLVPFKRRLSDFTAKTSDGNIPTETWALVGGVKVDIQRDDTFTYNGDLYKVISVEPKTNDRSKTDRVVAEIQMQGQGLPLQES